MKTQERKNSHLTICLEEDVEARAEASGFSAFRFDHDALPEINKADVSLETTLFGKKLAAPFFIGAMTGGSDRATEINRRLAVAAQKCGVGFALGSQRKMLEDSSSRASYAVKEAAPDLRLVIGNLGAVQLNYGVGISDIKRLIQDVGCDAFNFHLNPLQEAVQPEGQTNFSELLPKLRAIIPQLGVPVILKEVGSGISETTALKLRSLPLSGVETAGVGGTSWSKIESMRTRDPIQRSTGELFSDWGIPTAESVMICRKVLPDLTVIASGGLRNGIEAAKALTLGADAVAVALPMLKAASISAEAVVEAIERLTDELKTTMFLTGSRTIGELKTRTLLRMDTR